MSATTRATAPRGRSAVPIWLLLEVAPPEYRRGRDDQGANVEQRVSRTERHVRRSHRLAVYDLRANVERRQVRQYPVQHAGETVGEWRLDNLVEVPQIG